MASALRNGHQLTYWPYQNLGNRSDYNYLFQAVVSALKRRSWPVLPLPVPAKTRATGHLPMDLTLCAHVQKIPVTVRPHHGYVNGGPRAFGADTVGLRPTSRPTRATDTAPTSSAWGCAASSLRLAPSLALLDSDRLIMLSLSPYHQVILSSCQIYCRSPRPSC